MSPVYKQSLEQPRGTGPKPYRYTDPRPRQLRTRPKTGLVKGNDPTQQFDGRRGVVGGGDVDELPPAPFPPAQVHQLPRAPLPHQAIHDGGATFYQSEQYYNRQIPMQQTSIHQQHDPSYNQHDQFVPYHGHVQPMMFPQVMYGGPNQRHPHTYSTPNQRRTSHSNSASYSHGSRSRTSVKSHKSLYAPRRMRETVPFYAQDDAEVFHAENHGHVEEFDEFQALYSHQQLHGHDIHQHNLLTEETTMNSDQVHAMEKRSKSKSKERSKSKSVGRSSKSVDTERRRSITLSRLSDIDFSSTASEDSDSENDNVSPPRPIHSPLGSPYGPRRSSHLPGVPMIDLAQTVVHQPMMGSDIDSIISSNVDSGVIDDVSSAVGTAITDDEDEMGVQKRMRVRDAHRVDSGVFWFLSDHFSILRLMNRPYRHETGLQARDIRSWQDIDIKRIFRGWLELQRKNQSWTSRKPKATVFQVTNSAKEVLVHFENDEHKYWIPEIIAKNITKEQKEKELKKREPAESVTKKVVAPMNIDSLDSLFSGATGAKANVVKKKKIDKQWLEIPVLRNVLEEASEEDQHMICNGLRLTPLSLHLGGYYLDFQHCPAYSDMPYITVGYRAESKNYVFSCLSCCLLPPSNKFVSLWLSFTAIIVQISLSAIAIRDFSSALPSSLRTLLVLQLIFGIFHFGATWMYHIASNVSHASLIGWWRRSVYTFALWMASCYSYTITVVGFCDSYTTSIIFTSLLWVCAVMIFIPIFFTTSPTHQIWTKFLSISLSFCTICFICFLFILNNSNYVTDQLLMLLPNIFSLVLMYFHLPEKKFRHTGFFQFFWTSINFWLSCRILSLVFYHSLTYKFLEDWEVREFDC